MTFLNPLMLLGLVAAGIPLLIHLFNFRRPKRVDFSSLVFLRELQQTTMQRVRIKQWLLLILRTLAIALLVLAFARPTLKGSIADILGGDAESATVLVVDNSLSMTVRDLDGILLDQARSALDDFADLLRPGDQIAVLPVGSREGEAGRWLKNRQSVLEEAAAIEPSGMAGTLSEKIAEAGRMLESSPFVNREVFVLSDLQTSMLGDTLGPVIPNVVPVRLVKIGRQDVANAAVTDVRVVSQIVEVNRPVRIEATISASVAEGESSVLGSVFLDGERSAQFEAEMPSNASTTVELVVTPRRAGWLEGTVVIEDDALPDDNGRFFALAVPKTRRVLLVSGEGFDERYLSLALSTEIAPGRTRYVLDAVSVSGISSRRLTDYDAVILAGVSGLSSGQISAIATYVSGGGGLLLFPSSGSDSSSVNSVLARLGGGTVASVVGATRPSAAVAVIDGADTEHPLFEGVFQTEAGDEKPRLEQLDVYRYAAYRSSGAAEATLVRLSTGQPFLQEIPSDRGRVLFVASLPTPDWSELPVRGLFVPLIYRSLSYLSAGDSPAGDFVTLGHPKDIQLPGASESGVVRIMGEDVEAVPLQRATFGGIVVGVGAELSAPGIYDVMIGDQLVRKLSANLDPRESDLRTSEAGAASELLRGGADLNIAGMPGAVAGGEGFVEAVTTMRTGVELWNVFLEVALVILLAEMLVSRLWKPESASA